MRPAGDSSLNVLWCVMCDLMFFIPSLNISYSTNGSALLSPISHLLPGPFAFKSCRTGKRSCLHLAIALLLYFCPGIGETSRNWSPKQNKKNSKPIFLRFVPECTVWCVICFSWIFHEIFRTLPMVLPIHQPGTFALSKLGNSHHVCTLHLYILYFCVSSPGIGETHISVKIGIRNKTRKIRNKIFFETLNRNFTPSSVYHCHFCHSVPSLLTVRYTMVHANALGFQAAILTFIGIKKRARRQSYGF